MMESGVFVAYGFSTSQIRGSFLYTVALMLKRASEDLTLQGLLNLITANYDNDNFCCA